MPSGPSPSKLKDSRDTFRSARRLFDAAKRPLSLDFSEPPQKLAETKRDKLKRLSRSHFRPYKHNVNENLIAVVLMTRDLSALIRNQSSRSEITTSPSGNVPFQSCECTRCASLALSVVMLLASGYYSHSDLVSDEA